MYMPQRSSPPGARGTGQGIGTQPTWCRMMAHTWLVRCGVCKPYVVRLGPSRTRF